MSTPLKYFRCPSGHEQHDTEEFSFALRGLSGEEVYDTGPMCYRCVFSLALDVQGCSESDAPAYDEGGPAWYRNVFRAMTTMFQTKRIAAPATEPTRDVLERSLGGAFVSEVLDAPANKFYVGQTLGLPLPLELGPASATPLVVTDVNHANGTITFDAADDSVTLTFEAADADPTVRT